MLFEKRFFRELSATRASAVFPAEWALFAGHFPGKPVVPAYALVGLVLAHAEHAVEATLEVRTIDRMKLTRAVSADEAVTSEIETTRQEDVVTVRSRLSTAAGDVGTLSISTRV